MLARLLRRLRCLLLVLQTPVTLLVITALKTTCTTCGTATSALPVVLTLAWCLFMTGYDLIFLLLGWVMLFTRSTIGLLFLIFCWYLGQRSFG